VSPGGIAPRSFDNFQINIIRCQPDETCVSEPDTQIMGWNLGKCKPIVIPFTTPRAPTFGKKCARIPDWIDLTGRIIGGESAKKPIPWQVWIPDYECGGTILDTRTILTAANCFPYYKDENFQIYAGITEKHEPGKYGQERYVKSVTIHPNYDESTGHTLDYDLAILKLSDPLKFNKGIRPACLPPNQDFHPEVEGNVRGVVSGWGYIKDQCHRHDGYFFDDYCDDLCVGWSGGCCYNEITKDCKNYVEVDSEELQYVVVPLMTNSECKDYGNVTNNMICAGGEKDSCYGDAGGPLVIKRGRRDAVVYGVVSHGASLKCGDYPKPGIYTRVANFLSWIRPFLD
jgi:hypothetical protein